MKTGQAIEGGLLREEAGESWAHCSPVLLAPHSGSVAPRALRGEEEEEKHIERDTDRDTENMSRLPSTLQCKQE